ncbi:hypothetical protein SAMN06295926_104208 [Lysinibacillus sp. AC-3]|nr:hypothetical protein SAMN06295926_104208 [Lysinibacillus sp. AC-3]
MVNADEYFSDAVTSEMKTAKLAQVTNIVGLHNRG